MLSVETCKKIMGKDADNLTDENIEQIRDDLYIVANLAFSHWQQSYVSTDTQQALPGNSK